MGVELEGAATVPECDRRCDCSHPGECLFLQPESERPSFLVVWIVGAVVLAAVILALVLAV